MRPDGISEIPHPDQNLDNSNQNLERYFKYHPDQNLERYFK